VISFCQAIFEIQDLTAEPRVFAEYLNLRGIYFYAEKMLCKSSSNNYINLFHTVRSDWWTVYITSVFKTFSVVVSPSGFDSASDCHVKIPHGKGEGKGKGRGEGKIIVSGECEKCPGEVTNISAISGVKMADLLAISMHY